MRRYSGKEGEVRNGFWQGTLTPVTFTNVLMAEEGSKLLCWKWMGRKQWIPSV